ncbi:MULTISPECIES: hypothetical protein [Providencia]|uniref:hypothetical protein n=1 Tax=Providencia TaxID=586 RepID=UPI00197CDE59|nr:MULTISPECIES: hypothetical protein [Providencia]MBN4866407.1 hypothetical protein [Providencia stuartii]MBN4875729.1 hypothetical protein [Providencia stuartii]MBN4880421.1 hypothetical protein [Providencia stuartii]MBN4884929.1 hypothetical protein [Providencia stuartii]
MRKIITPAIPSHNYHYQSQRTNKNFILDNINSIKSNNNDRFNKPNYKKEYKFNVDIPYLASKEKKSTPIAEKQKPVLPVSRTKLEDIKTIDSFVRRIKDENICYSAIDDEKIIHRGVLNIAKKEKITGLYLNSTNSLGHGAYGTAYRIGNFVIKVPFYDVYHNSPHSDVYRCSSLLNKLNKNTNFSRAITLNNGKDVLISKYISGKNIRDNAAYDFVKQKGHIIFDYGSNGNIKVDNNGKKYVIDADLIAQPTELKRYPSLGTLAIRKVYKNIFIKNPLGTNEKKPLYYSEIEDLLPSK